MKLKSLLYKPIYVEFWDHAQNHNAIKCKVVGFLYKVTDLEIRLCTWDCEGLDSSSRLANMEWFSLLRSAIIELSPLKKY
jgi:hypothetical protein